MWADDISSSFHQAVNWLDICGQHGITLNPSMFIFAADKVEFAEFEITNDSVSPCKEYLDAIRHFPTPHNITEMHSWFGLINQVSYTFVASECMFPFCESLKPGTPFLWNNELNQLFETSRSVIIKEIEDGVHFDKSKPTCLATDWSKTGIGYWLFQKNYQCPSTEFFCCHSDHVGDNYRTIHFGNNTRWRMREDNLNNFSVLYMLTRKTTEELLY